jgi:hypothetical protein
VQKVAQNFCATSVIFKNIAQSKQSPKGRKFAQSGHPVWDRCYDLKNIFAKNIGEKK